MAMVFYDTETTGTNTWFDQILQFAAILTDSELNELDRFEIRCRLQPHIVPAPGAICVTGVSIEQLTNPELPTHYEMVRAIRDKLLAWSPAVFVGYNSIRFDEPLLRQALYQSLHPPYLTNTGGNVRTDAMRMVQAASIYAPNKLTMPLNEKNKRYFKLEYIAPANGFDHANAHDAMADVEATIYMSRLVMDRAPDVWSSFMRFSQKSAVLEHLAEETVISLSDVYPAGAFSYLVTALGPNAANSSEHYAFDLGVDPDELRTLSNDKLAVQLNKSPKAVRLIKCNGAPMLMSAEEAPEITRSLSLGTDELERRANDLRDDSAFCERLIAAYESTRKVWETSVHVEKQIYDGFAKPPDEQRMVLFHKAPWGDRAAIVEEFDDARLNELGRRLLYFERPDVLDEATRRETELAVAHRIAGQDDDAPWLTLPKAIEQIDDLLATANQADGELLRPHRKFLVEQADRLIALLQ